MSDGGTSSLFSFFFFIRVDISRLVLRREIMERRIERDWILVTFRNFMRRLDAIKRFNVRSVAFKFVLNSIFQLLGNELCVRWRSEY